MLLRQARRRSPASARRVRSGCSTSCPSIGESSGRARSLRARDDAGADPGAPGHGRVSTDRWKPQGSALDLGGAQLRHDRAGGAGVGAVLVGDLEQCADGRGDGDLLHRVEPERSLDAELDEVFLGRTDLSIFVLWQLFVFLATLIASVVIFSRAMRWKRVQLEFRSPIVVNRTDSTSPGECSSRFSRRSPRCCAPASGGTATRGAVGDGPAAAPIVGRRGPSPGVADDEGRLETWCLLAVIGLVILPG